MRIWKVLHAPMRAALLIALAITVSIVLEQWARPIVFRLPPGVPEWIHRALLWTDRLWLPAVMLVMPMLSVAFGAGLLWSSVKRHVASGVELSVETSALGQWIALALVGDCIAAVLLRVWTSGAVVSDLAGTWAIVALGLFDSATTIATVSAVVLACGIGEAGRLRVSMVLLLLATLIGTVGARIAHKGHYSVALIFPLLVYLVAQHTFGRRAAENA